MLEKSSSAVRRAKEAIVQRDPGIREPRSHQEEVSHLRDDLNDFEVVIGLGEQLNGARK